jgi:hypothetical protein
LAKSIATAKTPHGTEQSIRNAGLPHQSLTPEQSAVLARPKAFKRGGKVKKSGWAKVHKGEKIVRGAAGRVMVGRKKPAGRNIGGP